ncbi:MAG: M48 family metallopeptidase [Betaproteobacteria bacterium]|nr:M48 family metallopeptidase [Betaproteobacteria bacterium]
MLPDPQLDLPLGRAFDAAPRRTRKAPADDAWRDAAPLAYLGRGVTLRLDGARERAELAGDVLFLPLPPEAEAAQIRDRAQGWLQGEARRVLGERLTACAQQLGLPVPAWQLAFTAGLQTEMGADGRLRLPWRLVQLAPELIDRRLMGQLQPLSSRAGAGDLWDAAPLSA